MDENFELDVEVKGGTEKALLVHAETGDEFWVPRSVITEESEIPPELEGKAAGSLSVAGWWAKEHGLS